MLKNSVGRLSVLLVCGGLFLLWGCGAWQNEKPSAAHLSSVVPGNHYEMGRLGLGYNSFSEQFSTSNCVAGEVAEVGSASSQLDYLQDLDSSQLTKRMGITLGWSVPYLSLSPELEFVKSSSATKLSNTHVVLLQMKAKSEILKGESLALTPTGSALAGALPEQVFASCGDEYVSRIDYGGALLASLKIEFSSEDDKTEFNAKASFSIETGGGPAAINASFSRLSEKLRLRTRVVVSAKQFGGQPAGLLRIIPTGVANCTLEAVGECVLLFENLLTYARDGFQDQYTTPADYVPVSYFTTPYKDQTTLAGQLEFAKLNSSAKIDRMAKLGASYRSYLTDQLKVQKLLAQYSGLLNADAIANLQLIERGAGFNADKTAQAMARCAGYLSEELQSGGLGLIDPDEACAITDTVTYDAHALEQKILQTVQRVAFFETNPTRAIEIRGSAQKRLRIKHDIADGVLEIALIPSRSSNCERGEWIEVSFPFSVAEDGHYQVESTLELGECAECEKSAFLRVDEVEFPLEWLSANQEQAKTLQLAAGNHRFGVLLRQNNVCKSQNLLLKLRQLRIAQVIEPFSLDGLGLN